MIYLLLMGLEIASHKPMLIPQNHGCENRPNIYYYVEAGLVCIPTDLINKNGFEQ